MKHLVPLIFSLILAISAFAQTEVRSYVPGITADGVVYCLPKTAFRVAITASKVTKHPGDFHLYARRFLRLTDVIDKEETTWKIDKVQLIPYSVADTSKTYLITLRKNTSAPLCTLSEDGVILCVNAQCEQPKQEAPELINSSFNNKKDSRNYLSQEILAAGSELKMAELVSNEIYNIRESRSELTKGEADYMPKDGEQLKLMLSKLDEQNDALTQMFSGYTEGETKTWTTTYTPSPSEERGVLFRFSQQKGILDKDDLSGEPVYINVKNKKTVPMGKTVITDKKLQNKVLYYNIPSVCGVDITFHGASLWSQDMPLAQFGHEEYLSEDLFNKRTTCHIWFNPLTGNISKIEDDTLGK